MQLAAKSSWIFDYTTIIGFAFLIIALIFVYRSFNSMRITKKSEKDEISFGKSNKKDQLMPELMEEVTEGYLSN